MELWPTAPFTFSLAWSIKTTNLNPINHGFKHTIIADKIQTFKYSSICLPRIKPTTSLVFHSINLRLLWCSSLCWKQVWYIFNVVGLIYYYLTSNWYSALLCWIFISVLETRFGSFKFNFFNNFKLLRIRCAKYTPYIVMYL